MADNTTQKAAKKGPFSDIIFTTFFILMLAIPLFGGRAVSMLTNRFGLGPGWPELTQGGLGFVFMVLLAVRAIQLGKRARLN